MEMAKTPNMSVAPLINATIPKTFSSLTALLDTLGTLVTFNGKTWVNHFSSKVSQ